MAQKYTEARKEGNRKWDAANLDRLSIALPKGSRDTIKDHAAARGESVNGFIGRAISETMERDSGGIPLETAGKHPESTQGAVVVSLPSETLEAAQRAADRAGEPLHGFLARAVRSQVAQDAAPPRGKIAPAPVSFDNPAISENVGYICAMINRGEMKAASKGRSKVSRMSGYYLENALETGYTMDEIRAAAEKAAQEGYTGGWSGLCAYCEKIYGKRPTRH